MKKAKFILHLLDVTNGNYKNTAWKIHGLLSHGELFLLLSFLIHTHFTVLSRQMSKHIPIELVCFNYMSKLIHFSLSQLTISSSTSEFFINDDIMFLLYLYDIGNHVKFGPQLWLLFWARSQSLLMYLVGTVCTCEYYYIGVLHISGTLIWWLSYC